MDTGLLPHRVAPRRRLAARMGYDGVRRAPGRIASARAATRWSVVIVAAGTVAFVVGLWVVGGGIAAFAAPGGSAMAIGRLTGLVAADLLLIQVLLMARLPPLERAFGSDALARGHRLVGHSSLYLMVAHIVLITLGYAAAAHAGILAQAWDFTVNYPGMLLAIAGTILLIVVVATSIRAAKRRMRHESWHLLHLYAYLGVGLALPHQLWTGSDFTASPVATVFWWTLWALAAGLIVTFRLVIPAARSWYHRLTVETVQAHGAVVRSIVMRGRHLDRLGARPGQYFQWRFLSGPGWTRAHPLSLSAVPRQGRYRVTLRLDGDDGHRLAALRPGTPAWVEGPYGALTGEERTHRDVLLVAAGMGITPLRALAEQIATEPASEGPGGWRPPSVVLIHRVRTMSDGIFDPELRGLAARSDVRVQYLAGPRDRSGSWLPAMAGPADPVLVLRAIVPDIARREIYLCGPTGWMRAARRAVRAAGVRNRSVHREDFGR